MAKVLALLFLLSYVAGVEAGGRGPSKKFVKKDMGKADDDDWDEEQKRHQDDVKAIEAMNRILRLSETRGGNDVLQTCMDSMRFRGNQESCIQGSDLNEQRTETH